MPIQKGIRAREVMRGHLTNTSRPPLSRGADDVFNMFLFIE